MLKRKTKTKVKRTNKLIGEGESEEKIIPAKSHKKTKPAITTLYRTSFSHFYSRLMRRNKEMMLHRSPLRLTYLTFARE